jgi:hypothetical protein
LFDIKMNNEKGMGALNSRQPWFGGNWESWGQLKASGLQDSEDNHISLVLEKETISPFSESQIRQHTKFLQHLNHQNKNL